MDRLAPARGLPAGMAAVSRTREIVGQDAEGRPIARWSDAPELEQPLPTNPPGPIERRLVEPSLRAGESARLQFTGGSGGVYAPSDAARRQAARNAAQARAERLNGHTKEPVMPDQVIDPTPFELLEAAARRAREAHEGVTVAEEDLATARLAWLKAQQELEEAWGALPIKGNKRGRKPATDGQRVAELLEPPPPTAGVPEERPDPVPEPTPHQRRELTGRPATPVLTKRQEHVLELIRKGMTRQQIATDFGVAYQSIDGMLKSIGKKGLLEADVIARLPASFARYRRAGS